MNKIFKIILSISIAIFSVGFLSVSPANATAVGPLIVEYSSDAGNSWLPLTGPIFNETNFLPGQGVTRLIRVTNYTQQVQRIAAEAINEIDNDNFASQLNLTIKEGATIIFNNTLAQFFNQGETYLSELLGNGGQTQYNFTITFNPGSGNEYQEKTLGFDILVGFEGTEGGLPLPPSGGGTGNGGGGGLPPGLTITNETELNIQATSITVTWLTNYNSTSQVIYGSESENHTLNLNDNAGSPPKYGYAHTTFEYDVSPKISFHSVVIAGLTPGTKYYYRAVSHASLAIGQEFTFTTLTSQTTNKEESGQKEEGGEPFSSTGEEVKGEKPGQLAGGVIAGEEGEKAGELSQANEIVVGAENKPSSTLFGSLLATMGNLFNRGNLCWILIILIFVLIALFFLSDNKKTPEGEKKQRSWVLPLIIVLLIILYGFLCPDCLLLVIIFSVLLILRLLLWRKLKK